MNNQFDRNSINKFQIKDINYLKVTLEIFEPNEIIRGVIEQITYPVISNNNVGSDTTFAIITVRGTRQTTLTDVTSIHVPGIAAFGIMRYGA